MKNQDTISYTITERAPGWDRNDPNVTRVVEGAPCYHKSQNPEVGPPLLAIRAVDKATPVPGEKAPKSNTQWRVDHLLTGYSIYTWDFKYQAIMFVKTLMKDPDFTKTWNFIDPTVAGKRQTVKDRALDAVTMTLTETRRRNQKSKNRNIGVYPS